MRRTLPHLPALLTGLICLTLLAHGPIPQTENYHAFADEAAVLGIANGHDVLSNLGFAFVGLWGVVGLWPRRTHAGIARGWPGYALFLTGHPPDPNPQRPVAHCRNRHVRTRVCAAAF